MSDPPEWIYIKGGKHKGKTLLFVKFTEKRVGVKDESSGDRIIYLLPEHVDITHPSCKNTNSIERSSTNDDIPWLSRKTTVATATATTTTTTTWVKITEGKHRNKIFRYVKHTAERVAVERDDGKIIYLFPGYVKNIETENDAPKHKENNHFVQNMEMIKNNSKSSYCFKNKNRFSDSPCEELAIVADEEESIGFMTAAEDISTEDEDVFSDSIDIPLQHENCDKKNGDVVQIYSGTHAGKKATFIKNTPKRVALKIDGTETVTYLSPNAIDRTYAYNNKNNTVKNDVNDPLCQAIRSQLPNTERENVSIANVTDSVLNKTLFGVIFKNNKPVFFDMETLHLSKLPHEFIKDGQTFHLVSVKLHDKAKCFTCTYVPAPSRKYVQNLLQKIGAFDELVPNKICARLELFLSTCYKDENIYELKKQDFCEIPEKGNVGCGFIPRHMIDRLVREHSPDICAIQVRIVIPSMGVFKGMLMEKSGIDKIELPSSMRKVKASINPKDKNVAWLLINQSGFHPYLKRKTQAIDSFQSEKVFSKQAQWMMVQKGVSRTYLQKPNKNHSCVVGVADPTDTIPSTCVFVSGISNHSDKFGKEILISRFPMTEASDGKILSIVKDKPARMSTSDWALLCSKPFGFIVFGNPVPGNISMPEQISQGDLDGDDYFICWDRNIIQDACIGDLPKFPKKNPPNLDPSTDWWTGGLEYMSNIGERVKSQKLIGRLHDLWLNNLTQNLQSNALIYGQAYKDSLVASKHGGKVSLPSELIKSIPMNLRCRVREQQFPEIKVTKDK